MSYAASGQLTNDAKGGSTFVNVHDDSGRLIEAREGGVTLASYAWDAFELLANSRPQIRQNRGLICDGVQPDAFPIGDDPRERSSRLFDN